MAFTTLTNQMSALAFRNALNSNFGETADITQNETVTGTWTFNNAIVGSITGNAATATVASTVTTNANLT